jgi:hypothetical protein
MKHITLRLGGLRCTVESVTQLLLSMDLSGAVFSGVSVWKRVLEPCLEVQLWNVTQDQVAQFWENLRQKCNVHCAHICNNDGSKAGCILDYLRPSLCPTAHLNDQNPNNIDIFPQNAHTSATFHDHQNTPEIFAMDMDF